MTGALGERPSRLDRRSLIRSFPNSLILLSLLGCHTTTPRPFFGPVTGAETAEIELRVPAATRALADLLAADSIEVGRLEPRDGYLETPWFDTTTGRQTHHRRLGPGVVQIRAWFDPTRAGHCQMTIETVIRPFADPSVAPRDLDQQAPADHPTAKRVKTIFDAMVRQYGDSTSR
jgi:hypothetical protein